MENLPNMDTRIEQTINALEGIKAAEPKAYFYTRLHARMERELLTPKTVLGWQFKPIYALSVPKNLDMSLLDGVIQVDAEPAREMARRCAREEGMLVGHLVRRHAGSHSAKTARSASGCDGAGLQLRHG